MSDRRVAFLGLGAIGAPMAAHLAAAETLTVWNRTAARATRSPGPRGRGRRHAPRGRGRGRRRTHLPADLARGRAAARRAGRAARRPGPGRAFLDCTSGDPAASRRLAARLAERGVAFADAPVSGGTNGAEAGTLAIMVGATRRPSRVPVRSLPWVTGSSTSARSAPDTRIKAVNNALLAVNILAVGEGLAAL